MSKSGGNALPLSACDAEIAAAVQRMYTDPDYLRASDPGRVEGNVVFTYLDAFDPDPDEVGALKERYRRGGLGDAALKQRLAGILRDLLGPIRERRAAIARDPDRVRDVLRTGTAQARRLTEETRDAVQDALGLFRL